MLWIIMQNEEGVIRRGQGPRRITLSEFCIILHIIRKPNPIISLLFIQNIKTNIFQPCLCRQSRAKPQQSYSSQRLRNIPAGIYPHIVSLPSNMKNSPGDFSQSETGKYFE